MANALATPMAVRAPTAPPTAAPLTQGQNQANQLANSGGSNAAYMAARGAAPIKTLGTAPLTATPKTATLQAPPMAAPTPAPQFTPLAQVSKPPAADDPRNREIPTNGDLQKVQSLNAQTALGNQDLAKMQSQIADQQRANTAATLAAQQANVQPFQWGDQHAQMFSQMMSQPGLPDNVKMALQQAQDHFAGGGPVPPSVAKTGERERQPQMPQPAGQPPTAPRPFKGRTTSMQRRGKGVGQPARSLPMTPTRAAQNYVQNTPFTPLMG